MGPLTQASNRPGVYCVENLRNPGVMDSACFSRSTLETKAVQGQPELLSETLLGSGDIPQTEETVASHQMQFSFLSTFLS